MDNKFESIQKARPLSETIIADRVLQEIRTALQKRLADLVDRLGSSEVQKLPFTATNGEESIGEEMIRIQKELLPQIYGQTIFESRYLANHHIQTRQYSCQLATAVNALKALDPDSSVTEEEIAKAVGSDGSREGNIWPHEVLDCLTQKHGLKSRKISTTLQAIDALLDGEKIILPLLPPKYPFPHVVLISGIKMDHGEIEFYVNNAQHNSYPEVMPLSSVIDLIIPYSFYKITPIFAVSKNE